MDTCRECGGPADPLHPQLMKDEKLCFRCWHWLRLVAVKDKPTTVRAKGHHYQMGDDRDPFPGFAGATWTVKFHDGRVVTTKNLWHQGEVPEHFRERLPDNAEFVVDPDMAGRVMPA